jgi:hypothetical protein
VEPEGSLPHSQEPATCPYPVTVIANKSKQFTNDKQVKECILKEAEILCPEKHLFKNISLSLNTVDERLNDLAGLKEKCKPLRPIQLQFTRAQMLKILHCILFLIEVLMGTLN